MALHRKIKMNADGGVEIQHFDDGGAVQQMPAGQNTTFTAHPNQTPNQVWGGATTDSMKNVQGLGGPTTNNPITNTVANGAGSVMGTVGQNGAIAAHALGDTTKGIASAFTAQNGYNAQLAPTDYTNYQPVIGGAANNALQGYGQFNQNLGQQQTLAQALGAQAQGQGPNPAQAMLANQTGQNIAAQNALMAGQRGAGANVGLMARQAAQQGANTQQQAVGQGAGLQAQQQIAAQQEQAQLLGQMGSGITAEQVANNQLFGGAASAQNAQNANQVSNYGMMQGINSQVAQNNANAVNKTTSGLMGGASSLAAMLSKGGIVPDHIKEMAKIFHPKHFADGGSVYSGNTTVGSVPVPTLPQGEGVDVPGSGQGSDKSSSGGSKGAGGMSAVLASNGGEIGGKAKIKGDSPKNDTVPAMLSPGEAVIPRHIMESDSPGEGAKKFVEALLAKQGKPKEHGEFKEALKKAIGSRKK